MSDLAPYLFAAGAAGGAGLIVWSLIVAATSAPVPQGIEARIQAYGAVPKIQDDDLDRLSFKERIIEPQVASLLGLIARATPGDYLARVDESLLAADRPGDLTAVNFMVVRAAAAATAGAIGAVLGSLLSSIGGSNGWVIPLLALVFAALAWAGAWFLLKSAISARRHQMELALPNLIDFLVIAVDAGLTLDRALSRVVTQYENPLIQNLKQFLAEVELGRPRLEALEDFGRKSGVESINSFVQALVSSERNGVPIADTLRVQAETARWRRSDKAQKLGAQATIKMTIPIVVFIFPTIWLVLLGPALFTIFKKGI